MKKISIVSIALLLLTVCMGCKNENEASASNGGVDISDIISRYETDSLGGPTDPELFFRKEIYMIDFISREKEIPNSLSMKDSLAYNFLKNARKFYNLNLCAMDVWSEEDAWIRFLLTDSQDEEIAESIRERMAAIGKLSGYREITEPYCKEMMSFTRCSLEDFDSGKADYGKTIDFFLLNNIDQYVTIPLENAEDTINAISDSLLKRVESNWKKVEAVPMESRMHAFLDEIQNAESFDDQCSLALQAACHAPYMDEWNVIVMDKLLSSKTYSPQLFKLWVCWRAVCQTTYYGSSRDSQLKNDYYNNKRKDIFITYCKRINEVPSDTVAMQSAMAACMRPNILRNNEYLYGNSALLEMMIYMPDRYDTNE